LIVLQSIHRLLKPEELLGGQVFAGVKIGRTTSQLQVPEANPYRPTTPMEFGDSLASPVDSFIREQTATIREQHNLTQAGDTTFPWQILTQTQAPGKKIYTLGSLGRFYHETLGLILARYVQFKNLSSDMALGSPVGFLKSVNQINWQVTDRIDLSSPDMVLGIIGAYSIPEDESYGWVIVNGATISSVGSTDLTLRAHGEPVSWNATGEVSVNGIGRVVGRIQGAQAAGGLLPGALFVETESWSKAQLAGLFNADFSTIANQIDELQKQIDLIGNPINYQPQIDAINTTLTNLVNRMATEELRRANADRDLNQRINAIDAVSQDEFNQTIQTLTTQLTGQIAAVSVTATSALNAANRANDRIDKIPIVDVDALNATLSYLLSKGDARFPLVDGSVPPNLVYLDDGSLVWEG